MSLVKYLLSSLYALGIYGAFMAGSIYLRTPSLLSISQNKPSSIRSPKGTILLLFLVGIASVLQFFSPALLDLLQRDFTRFVQGEWWRLVTPLFVQDGGLAGTLFNLVSLLLVGILAEQFWGSLPVLLIFFLGGFVGEIAGFAWQPVGAGNSVANFALAGSILTACLLRQPNRLVLSMSILALSTYIVLIGLHDIHGPAAIAGMFLALMVSFLPLRKTDAQSNSGS